MGAIAALFGAGIWLATSLYMGTATFAFFLMLFGMYCRRRDRNRHRALMFSAMGIDLSLVLILEIQRSAMETVLAFDLNPLQISHVLASTLALLLYLPLILLGTSLWGQESARTRLWHRRLGFAAFTLRTIGFLLMFSLIGRTA
jgi:hypothetical protein